MVDRPAEAAPTCCGERRRRRRASGALAGVTLAAGVGLLVPGVATPAPATLPWVIVTTSNASALTNALNGVSCTSANACTAVGDYFATAATQQTLIEASNGGTWSIVTSPNSSTTETNVLFGVSCVSSTVCTAVGTYIPAGGLDQSLIESWDGTSWSIVKSPNTSPSEDNELLGVSCTSAMACTAVGLHLSLIHI